MAGVCFRVIRAVTVIVRSQAGSGPAKAGMAICEYSSAQLTAVFEVFGQEIPQKNLAKSSGSALEL